MSITDGQMLQYLMNEEYEQGMEVKLDAPVYCEQYDYDRPDKWDPSITSQPDIVKDKNA